MKKSITLFIVSGLLFSTNVICQVKWKSISAGSAYTLALKADGTIWGWGYNHAGQLGDGTTIEKHSPVQIGTENNWMGIFAGQDQNSYGLKTDGSMWAWGNNMHYQLGDGTAIDKYSPVQIGAGVNRAWVYITAGADHALSLATDSTLWAWGLNGTGQFGDGTSADKYTPHQISSGKWIKLAAGTQHSLGIKPDSTLWGWGNNLYGQLGDGTIGAKFIPAQIGSDKWRYIAASSSHSSGIKANGTLWQWGYQWLVEGDTSSSFVVKQVSADTNWVSVGDVGNHCIALKSDGTIWAWGDNSQGQLGDGTTIDRITPVQIGSDATWAGIAAGGEYSFALKADRSQICGVGANNKGQLGDNTVISKTSFTCINDNQTGINKFKNSASAAVYPNPNTGTFTVQSKSQGRLSLINELGQVIETANLNAGNNYNLQFKDLNAGIYLITGYINNELFSQKIIVVK